jgi:adenine-specific DNA-methyltransferase
MEHTIWLSMMYPRLKLLKKFLCQDGAIFIQLDDNEQAYAKVICDEIFGRKNFVTNIVWQKRTSPDNRLRLGSAQDYILVYTTSEGGDKKFWR